MRWAQVADLVWVISGPRPRPSSAPHPRDLASCAGLPPWRAGQRLAGRAALRELLTRVSPAHAAAPVVADPGGPPRLADAPGVAVSVSHDGDAVAAAVSLAGPVGVDVQQVPDGDHDRLLRRCLGPWAAEAARWPRHEQRTELAWVWTAQEACVKAAGTGLRGRPWTIEVPPHATAGRWRDLRWVSLRDWSATPLSCAFHDPADGGRTAPSEPENRP
ncbi:4'-phosphopantetheinyl transferase family protein [Streptomyces griseoviridis]|uniref:4'-phosphopantetheinyl transferase superfamily protein n=1 Tax=Streptomyces griseoviridis TaxID=45398 RepID=A0A3S9Z5K3_STRGD|nr:4'-phosphopantetheinyl transferase superfamily protein [Streptomyces griseoviridis]AZS82969.1 4'-phosphopantetheinyl transferase superfamily protein [Streptomyces griseoviridis]QCN90180.1 4-phosphopantetheinyl transferase [Streptomyces griseoviridis]